MGWKAMSMSQRFKPLLNIYAYPRWSYCHWQKSTVQSKPKKKFLLFNFIFTNCLFHQQICEPVKSLKKCKYFRDVTWTYIQYPDNSTQQVMHCRCPKNSVAYLTRRHAYQTVSGIGYQYSFACNPQTVSFIWNFWNIENINFSVFYYRKWSAREKNPAGYSASAKIMTDLQLMTSTQLVYVNVRIKRSVLATI